MQEYWNMLAPLYDASTSNGAWTPNEVLRHKLQSESINPASVLDLGTGTGQTLEHLTQLYPDLQSTVAVDTSPSMMKIMSSKFPKVETHVIDFVQFLAQDHRRFDLITAIGCLEFVPNLPALLKTINKHLVPLGTLIFTYEPIVITSPWQSKHIETGTSSTIPNVPFVTYRWTQRQILEAMAQWGKIISKQRFVAYHKNKNPVTYELLQVRSVHSST